MSYNSLECESGYFGPDCKNECGHCLNVSHCHGGNGTCLSGCSAGYIESLCTESTFFLNLYTEAFKMCLLCLSLCD